MSIIEDFRDLPRPDDDLAFETFKLDSGPHRIGKDKDGEPALILTVQRPGSPGPTVLEHILVNHNQECQVFSTGKKEEIIVGTVVRCRKTADDRPLQDSFLRVAEIIIKLVGKKPTEKEINDAIERLIVLFEAAMEAPPKRVQGLWAELFVMARGDNIPELVKAWHVTPDERYDFSCGEQRLEVKSTASEPREHYFRLEQVRLPEGTVGGVASMFVQRAGGGTSLRKLCNIVRDQLTGHPHLARHFETVLVESLGNAWDVSMQDAFDWEQAVASYEIFESSSVPSIELPLPDHVSAVRFKSNLSQVTPLSRSDLHAMGSLFRAASFTKKVARP